MASKLVKVNKQGEYMLESELPVNKEIKRIPNIREIIPFDELPRHHLLTREAFRKIEECASLGASNSEIALYVGVDRATLHNWQKEFPLLRLRIEELKERPVLKARNTIVKALDDVEVSKWYLE